MSRHVHTSTIETFEAILGPTVTSRAVKKARLVHATFDPDAVPPANPWPRRWRHGDLTLVNHAGVFSAERLDRGTRLLLDHLPQPAPEAALVDLGCGNGVLGLTLAHRGPDLDLTFVDESHRALASSRASWEENLGTRPARFLAADRLVNVVERGSVDLVVTNPPFHEGRSTGDAVNWEFFVDAHAVLRPGGELVAVGNRHLAHHAKLAKIFGAVEVVASDPRYVVHRATRE